MMLNLLFLWGAMALLAVGAGFVAHKVFKLSLRLAIAIGVIVFVGLFLLPVETHTVHLDMPKSSN